MKILIVTGGFFPGIKYGGPPVSVDNFCSLLDDKDVYIITKNHDCGETVAYSDINDGWNKRTNCSVLYLPDAEFKYRFFKKQVKLIKPDLIYLQGIFDSCIFPCLMIAKKQSIPVLLAPRGELCEGALRMRHTKKMLYLNILKMSRLLKNCFFQCTSTEEINAVKKIICPPEKNTFFLPNIPSKKIKLGDEKPINKNPLKLVFISRIHPKKNLAFALKILRELKIEVEFDIYGPIENVSYWDECCEIIKRMPKNVSVCYKGILTHDKVQYCFKDYDAFFFPTLSENYGHVILESLSVGTVVITSDQTPWVDLLKYNAGWSISLSNKQEFINAILKLNDSDRYFYRSNAVSYFELKNNINQLKKQYEDVLNKICEQK